MNLARAWISSGLFYVSEIFLDKEKQKTFTRTHKKKRKIEFMLENIPRITTKFELARMDWNANYIHL